MENAPRVRSSFWIKVLVVVVILGVAIGVDYFVFKDTDTVSFDEEGEACNVVALDIHGCIYTYAPNPDYIYDTGCDEVTASEAIAEYLNQAKDNDWAKAILLDIDSTGGQAQAALEIEEAIHNTGKPTIALIRGYGDSAAYWVATAADVIVASVESDVGGIGVTSSFVENSLQNEYDGVTYHSLSTGKFKDTGNPDKPFTKEEEDYIRKSLNITFENFIATVSRNRNMPEQDVRALADGRSWLGEEALEKGLIDVLGTYPTAEQELEKQIGEKSVVCWPQYADDFE